MYELLHDASESRGNGRYDEELEDEKNEVPELERALALGARNGPSGTICHRSKDNRRWATQDNDENHRRESTLYERQEPPRQRAYPMQPRSRAC